MRFAKNIGLHAVLILSCATPAMADCVYPKVPADPPNGVKATQDEMVAAMKVTKQYNADVQTYLSCLDTETASMIAALGADPKVDAIKQIKNKENLKHDAAVDDLQKYADTFNTQLRAFKAK